VYPTREKVQEGERKLRRVEESEVAYVAKPRKVQQEWRRSPVEELRKRAKEHCGKGMLEEAHLLELGWCTEEAIVLYLTCERCRSQEYHVEDNRGQGVISRKKLETLNWCGCKRKGEEKAVWPRKAKAQQERGIVKGRSGEPSRC